MSKPRDAETDAMERGIDTGAASRIEKRILQRLMLCQIDGCTRRGEGIAKHLIYDGYLISVVTCERHAPQIDWIGF